MPVPAPAAPGGQPQPGAPPAGGAPKPPFGATPATGSTPNKGYEAAGMQKLGVLVKQMETMLPELGASSDAGKAVLDCLSKLVKFVPAGSVTPAAQKNSIEAQQRQQAQGNQQMQALQAMRAKAAQGGAPGGAPGGQPGAGGAM